MMLGRLVCRLVLGWTVLLADKLGPVGHSVILYLEKDSGDQALGGAPAGLRPRLVLAG